MKCSKCHKRLVSDKKLRNLDEGIWYAIDAAYILAGGPIGAAIGSMALSARTYKKHIKNEVSIKCPHCGTVLTLTKEEYDELQDRIKQARQRRKERREDLQINRIEK